jgi:hypothetical protein
VDYDEIGRPSTGKSSIQVGGKLPSGLRLVLILGKIRCVQEPNQDNVEVVSLRVEGLPIPPHKTGIIDAVVP